MWGMWYTQNRESWIVVPLLTTQRSVVPLVPWLQASKYRVPVQSSCINWDRAVSRVSPLSQVVMKGGTLSRIPLVTEDLSSLSNDLVSSDFWPSPSSICVQPTLPNFCRSERLSTALMRALRKDLPLLLFHQLHLCQRGNRVWHWAPSFEIIEPASGLARRSGSNSH